MITTLYIIATIVYIMLAITIIIVGIDFIKDRISWQDIASGIMMFVLAFNILFLTIFMWLL